MGSQAVKRGWAKELEDCVLLFPGSVTEFIDKLLPCSAPFPEDDDPAYLDDGFANYNPVDGQEGKEYPSLLAGLRRLVESFPDDRKVEIADTHRVKMLFPFEAFQKHHREMFPDLSVSFPGKPLFPKTWEGISMVFEAKGGESEDPFPRDGERHARTVEQLAKNGRNLLLAHGFLCAFAVGVYGRTLRIVRFDHSCALVTAPFSLNDGGALLIKKFLWHFVHPLLGGAVVGCDPTMCKLDPGSQEWVKAQLEKAKPRIWEKHLGQLHEGRRVEVYDQETGRCVPYLLYHLVDVNGRLFSRATMVWRAIEDTRIWKDGQLVPDPTCTAAVKPRIVKEAWRQFVRTSEAKFYERLDAKIPTEERFGLAKMAHGGDIGAFEYRWWERTRQRNGSNTTSDGSPFYGFSGTSSIGEGSRLFGSSVLFCSTGSTGPKARPFVKPAVDHMPGFHFSLPHPQEQTYSWRLHGEEFWHRERSHMRMVIEDVGHPLTEFSSTRELVRVMRDAIIGHREAWALAGVLHRDVSPGNILIADSSQGTYVGFLHDFDYSSMMKDEAGAGADMESPAADADDEDMAFKERTGTYFYLATELLSPEADVIHKPSHDLESFFWVLLWVVLRHTNCYRVAPRTNGQELCRQVFLIAGDLVSQGAKLAWITRPSTLEVVDNIPLTTLLRQLRLLVCKNIPHPVYPSVDMSYEEVLALFDTALETEGWPESDWIPCTLLDHNDFRTGIAPILADVPPGYEDHSEGRRLRSQSLLAAIQSGGPAGPSTPRACGSTSAAFAASAGLRPRSAPKRLHEQDDRSAPPAETSHARKRSKKTEMEPPPHPATAAALIGGQTISGGQRQPDLVSRISRRPTRSSSRIKAQLEKKAANSDPSI
ncbi:hypothetical protein BD414DRAFT_537726 [Trametes punicea]|nr:hypothetical protein BD414DRAFT_537726 [Trametes punicea]